MALYVIGCSLALLAVAWPAILFGFIVLVLCDLFDCWMLHNQVRRSALAGELQRAERISILTGALQAFSLTIATSLYFFLAGEGANILFVIGALGMGAVNTAIALPKFPKGGLIKLGIYAITPVVFLSITAIEHRTWDVFRFTDVSGAMLLVCMIYMFISFTKAGLNNFAITQALELKESELKRANADMAVQQRELRKLSLVARKANDSIVLSSPDRRIIWVNEAFTEVTGYPFERAVGRKINELLSPDDADQTIEDEITQAVASKQPFHGEVENQTRDHRRIWVDVNLFPVHDTEGDIEFFVSIERDVTEAKKQADEMAAARLAAEEGARAKAEFLANMSHEIRTPLSGIIGMTDVLFDTDLTETQRRFIRTISGSSQALMTIINDVLDLSQLDAGRMELSPSVFRIETCFQDTIALLLTSAQNANSSLNLQIDDHGPKVIKADEGRLRQVIINLVGNAIKFTQNGEVSIHVHFEGEPAEPVLCFDVQDTGIGISEEKLERIFDRFTQAEASTAREFGGTGLGLTISRHIVNVMGGQISVSSKLGHGSTFSVRIPVLKGDPTLSEDLQNAPQERDWSTLAGTKILVAEDNETNRLLLGKYLEGLPIFLRFANDGEEAVAQAEAFHPDIILMDVSMPLLNGMEATQRIRQIDMPQPLIIALTAHAFEAEMQACFAAGMDHFLTKPIRKNTLLGWIYQNTQPPQTHNQAPRVQAQSQKK